MISYDQNQNVHTTRLLGYIRRSRCMIMTVSGLFTQENETRHLLEDVPFTAVVGEMMDRRFISFVTFFLLGE